MLTYRAILRPRAATRSPWLADMLFGHLCWLIRYEEGEAALHELLEEYRGNAPPLLLSEGFPGDWLPRPLLPPRAPVAGDKTARIAAMRAAKHDEQARWVRLETFDALRRGMLAAPEDRQPVVVERTELKNQINRLSGGTTRPGDEPGGNLYSAVELAFAQVDGLERRGLDVSVYVRAADAAWAERARRLFERLARGGYGAKKSAGYGHFALQDWAVFDGFAAPPGANGYISLSNWVPAQRDPTRGFYATLVKYGKLGEELAHAENPFKFPLIMLAAGSSFYAPAPIREWYGRLVEGIAPGEPGVVHYGYAFAVPALLEEEQM